MSLDPSLIKIYQSSVFGVEDSTEGGDIDTSSEIQDGVDQSIFDDVTNTERESGDIEYRKVFIRNENVDTANGVTVWLSALTDNASTTISLASATDLGTVGDEGGSATYYEPTSKDDINAITLGDLAQDEYAGVWIRRDVTAGALGENQDGFTIGYGTT